MAWNSLHAVSSLVVGLVVLGACGPQDAAPGGAGSTPASGQAQAGQGKQAGQQVGAKVQVAQDSGGPHLRPGRPFPDFGDAPPAGYDGPLFELSQEYPPSDPGGPLPDFLSIDFRADNDAPDMTQRGWYRFVMAVRDYAYAGNIVGAGAEVDYEACFTDVGANAVRPWYHMPWQHWGKGGRECIHGLTREASEQAKSIAPEQTEGFTTYAVGLYNARGGWQIGKVWSDPLAPDPRDVEFPEGTVVFKLLFTDAPVSQIRYLDPPLQWNAAIYPDAGIDKPRVVGKVSLIQMDIAVRTERAEPTDWLLGTLVYNGSAGHDNRWENMIPLGLMWGDDKDVAPGPDDPYATNEHPGPDSPTLVNPAIKESMINADPDLMAPQHLGYGMRLSGPVDNFQSSCMSCHGTAQWPAVTPILPSMAKPVPAMGSPEWMHWFTEVLCGETLDEGTQSLDYSLQLSQSLHNFQEWTKAPFGGHLGGTEPAAAAVTSHRPRRNPPADAP